MTELTGSLLNSGSPQLYTIAKTRWSAMVVYLLYNQPRIGLSLSVFASSSRLNIAGDIGQTLMSTWSTLVSVRFAYPISTGELVPKKPFDGAQC